MELSLGKNNKSTSGQIFLKILDNNNRPEKSNFLKLKTLIFIHLTKKKLITWV